ncbi:outer membrane protein assembly factor BamB family protein [Schlesneria paludicola]|uniref:outer membrane protein assembly factor BamB family protein n=1 Tax=Schlesneria paludicola TaxID=360056 RepID=UPI00029B4829|nr:PQQ-binding-like beta-propeller repeat protein [Schlesneria paludicola]
MSHPRTRPSRIESRSRNGWWLLILLAAFSPDFTIRSFCLAAEPEETAPVPPENADPKALQKIIRDLFGGRNPGGRLRPTRQPNEQESRNPRGMRDPIDNRAPRDVKVEQLLTVADQAIQQKNWKSAVDAYQRLLDLPEDSLHRSSEGKWQSVRQTVNDRFRSLPEATLAEYRAQFGGLANQQLMAARRSGRTADFVSVATRFFHTQAGYEAAQYLACQHFDRSEYELAAIWFTQLAASPTAMTRQDPWLLNAASALARAGDRNGAMALLERMSQGTSTMVSLGSGNIKASDWISRLDSEPPRSPGSIEDWTHIYGTASRLGKAVGGDALLSPNWTLPLTSSHAVRGLLKWLLHDLQDQQRALILAGQPLAVDGKVLYRDLRGIRCIDINTGHTLWEGVEGVSAERILGGFPSQQIDPQEVWRGQANPFQNSNEYQGASAEFSPLTSLLFRDGTYGLLSSDGHQLFVIEDHGILSARHPGQQWGWDGNNEPQDPFGVPWKTNRLVSYDLRTGKALWSLGGSESHESFDLPLAGSYFYGTPAIDGNEMFAVVGKADEVRLWALDRATGTPLWSQLIGYSDTKIDQDLTRRWIASQVAVGNGVIVCPTTVGWLVAIDRLRQSVMWAYRYAPRTNGSPVDRESGTALLPQRDLSGTWSPSAPIISGNHILFTPQDEPQIFCLNVTDGRLIWSKPKERGVYLAGVFQELVLVVGESNVTAYHIDDGRTVWVLQIDEGIRPSGRGIAVDDRYYLPLSSGALQSIDLNSGKVATQSFVGSQQSALGNLVMHHGKLLSLSPHGLSAFAQRDAVLAEINQRLTRDQDDPWALLRSSEIQLLNRHYADALPLLRKIPKERLSPPEQERYQAALIECLSTLIQENVSSRTSELDELGHLASSADDQLLFHELTAKKLLKDQQPIPAFEMFVRLAKDGDDDSMTRGDDRSVSVRRRAWLSGRLSEIWTMASKADRATLDQLVTTEVETAIQAGGDTCDRIGKLFAFHPAAVRAIEASVESLILANKSGQARIVLQQLIEHPDANIAAQATDRLARLMMQCHQAADAAFYFRRLESKFENVVVRDGLTGAELAARARADHSADFEPRPTGVAWTSNRLKLEQSVMMYSQPSHDVALDSRLPYFQRLSLESFQSDQRLALESLATGRLDWMIPLRSAVRAADDGNLTTRLIGHQMFFVSRGVLHAVSPLDKQVLWTKTLDGHVDGSSPFRNDGRPSITPMIAPGRDEMSQMMLLQRAYSTGPLAVVQPHYLCIQGRRSLSVLDPQTGREVWKLDGLPMNSQVVGTSEVLFTMIPGKNDVLAYRALDGKPLLVPNLQKLLSQTLLTHGSSLLLIKAGKPSALSALGIRLSGGPQISLQLHDPVKDKTIWQIDDLPGGSRISPLDDEEVVVARPDGRVQRIEVATGTVTALEGVPDDIEKSAKRGPATDKYLLADNDRIYLIANSAESIIDSSEESIESIRVHGTVSAWSRHDNRFLWQRSVAHHNLVVDRFASMPVFLFLSRKWKPRQRLDVGYLNVTAIHKQSGELLIDSKFPSGHSGFHALAIHVDDPSIELRSYNARIRLLPTMDAGDPQKNE